MISENPTQLIFVVLGITTSLISVTFSFLYRAKETQQKQTLEDSYRQFKNVDYLSKVVFQNQYSNRATFDLTQTITDRMESEIIKVDMVDLSYRSFLHDEKFKSAIISSLRRGVKFRIIICDPDNTNQVEYQENRAKGELAFEIRNSIEMFMKIMKSVPENLIEIRLSKSIPPSFLFITSDTLVLKPYIYGEHSNESPTFSIDSKDKKFKEISNNSFERTWQKSELLNAPLK